MTEEWVAKFLRGLTIGALIGAVIAGSRVWTRWGLRLPPRVAGLLPGRSSDPVLSGDGIDGGTAGTPSAPGTASALSESRDSRDRVGRAG
jgi:hypothetical protein